MAGIHCRDLIRWVNGLSAPTCFFGFRFEASSFKAEAKATPFQNQGHDFFVVELCLRSTTVLDLENPNTVCVKNTSVSSVAVSDRLSTWKRIRSSSSSSGHCTRSTCRVTMTTTTLQLLLLVRWLSQRTRTQ